MIVYARGIGDQPDALALKSTEAFVFQHFDAGLDANFLSVGGGDEGERK